jgi:hypothetical protein
MEKSKTAIVVGNMSYGPVENSEYVKVLDALWDAGFRKKENSKDWEKVNENGKFIASFVTFENGQQLQRVIPLKELSNVGK